MRCAACVVNICGMQHVAERARNTKTFNELLFLRSVLFSGCTYDADDNNDATTTTQQRRRGRGRRRCVYATGNARQDILIYAQVRRGAAGFNALQCADGDADVAAAAVRVAADAVCTYVCECV